MEWLRLSDDAVVIPSAPWGLPSPQRAYDHIICPAILRPSLKRLPGQTTGLPIRELWQYLKTGALPEGAETISWRIKMTGRRRVPLGV